MKILDHTARGATIHFCQTELLLVMALVEKGAAMYGCDNEIALGVERQFALANLLVENTRRDTAWPRPTARIADTLGLTSRGRTARRKGKTANSNNVRHRTDATG